MSTLSPITDATPGPSPWYLRRPGSRCVEGFRWEEHKSGMTVLTGPRGPVAALGFQNYASPLDLSTLLIWFQRPGKPGLPSRPVQFLIVKPADLALLDCDLDQLDLAEKDTSIVLGSAPIAACSLDTTRVDQEITAVFPSQLHQMDEILILCSSSAIGTEPGWAGDLALMIAQPKNSTYRLYPQDWFNQSKTDFGYQWVTRVARDPQTGRIHGDGIRIGAFMLDDSLRRVAVGFGPT
jgi:hypothetical protein